MTPCVRIFYPSEFTHFFKQGANQRRNEPTYDDTTRPMRCKAEEYQRRQDKLNLENPSKRKIFAKKSPNVPRRPRIWLNFISVKLPRPPRTWALPVILLKIACFEPSKIWKKVYKNGHNQTKFWKKWIFQQILKTKNERTNERTNNWSKYFRKNSSNFEISSDLKTSENFFVSTRNGFAGQKTPYV